MDINHLIIIKSAIFMLCILLRWHVRMHWQRAGKVSPPIPNLFQMIENYLLMSSASAGLSPPSR